MSTHLDHRYLLEAEIGRGGMGIVHRACDRRTGLPAATKRLLAGLRDDPSARRRFAREIAAMDRVDHPNVVGLHAFSEDHDGPWLAMDLCPHGSLAAHLADGPLDAAGARRLADDLIDALEAIHSAGLIHRDLNPQNVLRAGGRWVVSDFGIARGEQPTGAAITGGVVMGTPDYLTPEHAQDAPITPAADLYALGCVLYRALAGRAPYRAGNALRLAMMHATAPPPRMPAAVRRADPALADLVEDLLSKLPAARPTLRAARARLRATIPGRALIGATNLPDHSPTTPDADPSAAPPATAAPRAWRTARRHMRRRRAGALAAVLAAGALALGWAQFGDRPPSPAVGGDSPALLAGDPTAAPAASAAHSAGHAAIVRLTHRAGAAAGGDLNGAPRLAGEQAGAITR